MNEIIEYPQTAALPAMSIQEAVHRRQQMVQFVKSIMEDGLDYGTVPGTDKPTLLKPGAEKLTTFFGLAPRFVIIKEIENWDGGEPFFYYWYKCQLYRGSAFVGEGEGSANSHEAKYRWRWVPEHDLPPGIDPATLKCRRGKISEFAFAVDKAETTGKYGKPLEYWERIQEAIANGTAQKVRKSTRNGKEYDAWEIDDTLYRVPNEDIASLVNTLQKMGQKRSLVAAVLIACNASEFFTQDLEDFDYGHVIEVTPEPRQAGPLPTAHPPQTDGGNGGNGKEAPESVPPEKYATLPAPATWGDLWGDKRYIELGYGHQKHALNVIKSVLGDPKNTTVQVAWKVLVDHQLSKLAEPEPAEPEPEAQEQAEMAL